MIDRNKNKFIYFTEWEFRLYLKRLRNEKFEKLFETDFLIFINCVTNSTHQAWESNNFFFKFKPNSNYNIYIRVYTLILKNSKIKKKIRKKEIQKITEFFNRMLYYSIKSLVTFELVNTTTTCR